MSKVILVVCVLVVVVAAGGFAFLATWDMPPPSHPIEKVIANDHLGK